MEDRKITLSYLLPFCIFVLLLAGGVGVLLHSLFLQFTGPSLRFFKTDSDVGINLSPISCFLTKEELDVWSLEAIVKWSGKEGFGIGPVLSAIEGSTVTMIDQKTFPAQLGMGTDESPWTQIPAWGLTFYHTKVIYITSLGKGWHKEAIRRHIKEIYIHELSHLILGYVVGIWDWEEAHKKFAENGVT